MKVRTQLIAGLVVFALLLALISGLVITTNQQVEKLLEQERIANEIALEVGELGYLSNDFILYREPQQVQRWNAIYASLSDHIAALSVERPEQRAIVSNLEVNLRNMKSVFDDIESNPVQPGGTDTGSIQLSWSRMAVQIQGTVFSAVKLATLLGDEADGLREARNLFIFALIGAFVAFLLTSYLLFSRRMLKSIAGLQEGARIVGSGNLDHIIEEKGDDEFSELSRSFNRMTSDLHRVIATKADLEREVAGRKQAEEELIRANAELGRSQQDLIRQNITLNALNEELTTTQEELEQNIHELTRAETDLQRIAEQRQIALDAARMGWWHYDPVTRIASWDERFREIFDVTGYQDSDDKILTARTHPEDLPGIRAGMEAALNPDNPQRYSAEYRINLPGGSVRWIEAHGIASFEGNGEKRRATRFVGTVADITDRKHADQKVHWLAQFPLQNPHPVMRIMRSGVIIYANPASAPVLETWGVDASETVPPSIISFIEPVLGEDKIRELDIECKESVYSLTFSPLHDENCVNIYGMEITDRKRAEEALKDASNKLNLLTSITRHDILNQVMALKGFLILMKRSQHDDRKTMEMFDNLVKIADTIGRQITFTGDYQDMGVREPRWQQVEWVVMGVAASVRLNGTVLTVTTGSLEIFADPMLEKVFYNLLDNALIHGERVEHISISFRKEGDAGVVVFEDDGVGVPVSMKHDIFERGVGKVTGYGLFLVKEILDITGMSIRETGEEGKGARFEIVVPAGKWRNAEN